MLEETYLKFKKNILPKMKKMQPNFQEPVVEYCEPEQVIDICSYNHYPILDKSSPNHRNCNDDNDIYNTSELEHEFEYGIYEDVLKTEQLMAELKRIDEAENENKKSWDVHFGDFPLEQFSDAGKVANEGDPQLKAAADTELYEIEKRAIHIDTEKYEYDNSSGRTDDTNSSQRAKDEYNSQRADDNDENDILQTQVSHVQLPKNGEKYHDNHDDNTLRKMVYGPTYEYHLVFHISQKSYFTNYGINFFLYVISGQKFRSDLVSLFKCQHQQEFKMNIKSNSDSTHFSST